MRPRWTSIAAVVALVTVAAVGRARAQAVEPVPRLPVQVEAGAPDVTVRITGPGVDVPCGARCDTELPAGQYRVLATSADGRASARNVFIGEPLRLTVTPHNQAARVTGIALMPVGVAGAGAGLVMLWWAGLKFIFLRLAGCSGDCSAELPGWLVPAGLISLGAGVAVGVTGVVLWRSNAHADVKMNPLAPPPPRAQLRLRPVAGLRWTGLALTGSF
jgi:hypothetical protein